MRLTCATCVNILQYVEILYNMYVHTPVDQAGVTCYKYLPPQNLKVLPPPPYHGACIYHLVLTVVGVNCLHQLKGEELISEQMVGELTSEHKGEELTSEQKVGELSSEQQVEELTSEQQVEELTSEQKVEELTSELEERSSQLEEMTHRYHSTQEEVDQLKVCAEGMFIGSYGTEAVRIPPGGG